MVAPGAPAPYMGFMTDNADARLDFPATARNRDAILDVLQPYLKDVRRVLEVASGSGQHVAHWAPNFPHITWQPSDLDALHRQSIAAWTGEMTNVMEPLALDATAPAWPVEPVDMVFCANMIHIAPWAACTGLFARTAEILNPDGLFCLYGPFTEDGRHNAESNVQFDASLKARDPDWGIRDLSVLKELGAGHGLHYESQVAMPANNFTVFFRRHVLTG